MRRVIMIAATLGFAAAPGFAADDLMAGYYGNTVVSTGGMLESRTHYKADHTFDVSASAMGQSFNGKGTWAIDDKGQLCRTFEAVPPGMPNPSCIPAQAHKPGDNWTLTVNGRTRNLALKSGIQ